MNKLPVSVNLVIRNEEERLKKLLPILDAHFNEIIIIDQESIDSSREIALRYTEKVFPDVATGYPESSRALAASLSSNEWVFIIDADEIPNIRFLKDAERLISEDIQCVICHYGVFHPTEEIADYETILNYKGETETLRIRIAPRIFRLIKKSNLICNMELHRGIEMTHNTSCHYLKYHGIFHHKTEAHVKRVKDRYMAVKSNTYDKDIHI